MSFPFALWIFSIAQTVAICIFLSTYPDPAIASSVNMKPAANAPSHSLALPDPGPVSPSNLRHGPGGPWPDGDYTFYCGIFHTGRPETAHAGAIGLLAANLSFAAPPLGCLRVHCHDTTALYVCNDTPRLLAVPGADIAWMVDRLALLCCDKHHGLSAQLFHPTAGWNTVVAYGNCRHPADEPPAAFGVGNGGPNGNCIAGGNGKRHK